MAQYSKDDVMELARMALVNHDDHTGKAAAEIREMFPILDLRSAVEIVRLARTNGVK